MWQPALACPACRSPLQASTEALRCQPCGATFTTESGILRLLLPERRAAAAPFLEQYRTVRRADGHGAWSIAAYRALPDAGRSRSSGEWAIRRQSYQTLQRCGVLHPEGTHRVLDLGAGNGWLSNRLADAGHAAVAVDISDDDQDGLAAAAASEHAFPRIQADFDALPFEPAQFDVAVLNASLHYSPDPSRTLAEANRMVARDGALVVMDSPLFERAGDGEAMVRQQADALRRDHGLAAPIRAGAGFLTLAFLRQVTLDLGRVGRFVPSPGPLLWRLRRAWSSRWLGRAPAAFGVWVAR